MKASLKTFQTVLGVGLLAAALGVPALTAGCGGHDAGSRTSAAGATHKGKGVVVEVDQQKGKIKINHEKIDDYMDPMTMWFFVKDKALLNGLAPNDRVEFTVTEEQSADMLTEIKKL